MDVSAANNHRHFSAGFVKPPADEEADDCNYEQRVLLAVQQTVYMITTLLIAPIIQLPKLFTNGYYAKGKINILGKNFMQFRQQVHMHLIVITIFDINLHCSLKACYI